MIAGALACSANHPGATGDVAWGESGEEVGWLIVRGRGCRNWGVRDEEVGLVDRGEAEWWSLS